MKKFFNPKLALKQTLSSMIPDNIKGGIARDAISENYRSIFDALDKKNSNGILDDEEVQELKDAAGKNGIFSLREVKHLIKELGIRESTSVETFVSFLNDVIGLSAKIEKTEQNQDTKETLITFAEDDKGQQKVETRNEMGDLIRTVVYKNKGKENETYEVYENKRIISGKDERGEYKRKECFGYAISGQEVAYEKIRSGKIEYYNKRGACIGGKDDRGFYRCNELNDGKHQIFRGNIDDNSYELVDIDGKILGGGDDDGIYKREYTSENDYINIYEESNNSSKKIYYTDGKLSHTEIIETKNNKTYKKDITSTGITIEVLGESDSKITIDFNKITQAFKGEEKEKLIEALKQMPSQVLMDLFVEVTFDNSSVHNGEDGYFWSVTDKISLSGGSFDVETIVHELGHALDCIGKGDKAYFQSNNSNFARVFYKELTQYVAAGKKPCIAEYDGSGTYHTRYNDDGGNYATVDRQEMFAECYTLLMLGSCYSENVIKEYFPKTLVCVQEIIESTRNKPASVRHPRG